MVNPHIPQLLERLQAGNDRFVADESWHTPDPGSWPTRREASLPEAVAMVLACSDLGVSPERVFDLRPGELIVPQNAALTVDDAVAASVALAYELHGVNLLVVLGHARCCVLDSPDKHPRGLMRDEVRATLRCATQGETGKVHATRVASQLRQRFAQLPELHVAAAYMDESSGRVEFL